MHSERWAGQFHITNMFLRPAKGDLRRWRKGHRGNGGNWGRGRQNWIRNLSQWIKKRDSSFWPCCATMYISHSPSLSLSLFLPALQRPCDDWYAPRAKLATETEKIMHKRWVRFIVFSGGPREELKLWIYAVCDWMRAQTQGTDVERSVGHGEGWWLKV